MSLCGAVEVLSIRSIGSGTYSRMSGAKTLTKLIPRCIYIYLSNSLHALCRKCKLSIYLYSPGHPCAYIKKLWGHVSFFMHPYFECQFLGHLNLNTQYYNYNSEVQSKDMNTE